MAMHYAFGELNKMSIPMTKMVMKFIKESKDGIYGNKNS